MENGRIVSKNRKRFELSHPILDSKKDASRNDYISDIRKIMAFSHKDFDTCLFVWFRTCSVSEALRSIIKFF